MPSTVSYSRRNASGACCGKAKMVSARRTASRQGSTISSRLLTARAMRSDTRNWSSGVLSNRSSIRLSAHRLKHATNWAGPLGKRANASAVGIPIRRAAARSAARDHPSNGTSGSIPSIRAERWLSASGLLMRSLFRQRPSEIGRVALQLFEEDQQTMIRHSLRIQNPIEVIAFMLHNPGVETFDLAFDDLTIEPGALIANTQMPRYDAA